MVSPEGLLYLYEQTAARTMDIQSISGYQQPILCGQAGLRALPSCKGVVVDGFPSQVSGGLLAEMR